MKNLKRLMSVVLSVVMLMSLVVSTSAASFTDVAETDKAYEAIEVLAALDILEGKEAGAFDPEANIKRSEFAAVICRARNQASAAAGGASFTDVSADHWAAGYISWAASNGIVNGRGDGTFDPDANVSYNEAIAMIVRAMGYEWYVKNFTKGFPSGYCSIATSNKIDKDITASDYNAPATRADVATLVYNAFDAPLMDVKYISNEPEYAIYDGSKAADYEKRTLLSFYHDIYKVKVTVDETYRTDSNLVATNGAKLMKLTPSSVYKFDVDDVENALNLNMTQTVAGVTSWKQFSVIANDPAWAAYQGYTANAYIALNEKEKAEVVALIPDTLAGDELVIDNARELIAVADVADAGDGDVTFEYYESVDANRAKSVDIAADATVYVNNRNIGDLNDDLAGDGAAELEFEALAAGYYSSVTLLGADGVYTKIYLVDYEYGIVEEVDAELEIIETDNDSYYLSADDTSDEFVYNIYKDGVEIGIADLVEGDLLNVVVGGASVDTATFVEIYVTNNVIESSVSSVKDGGACFVIDGEDYYLANGSTASLDPGDTGSFFITIDGYIWDAEFTSTYSDNYAFILDVAESTSGFGKTWEIKLLDKNNAVRIIPVKSSVYVTADKFDADGDTDVDSDDALDRDTVKTEASATFKQDDLFGALQAIIHADASTVKNAANIGNRFVTFKEANGEITELVFPITSSDEKDFTASSVSAKYSEKTGMLGGCELVDTTFIFNVPNATTVASTMAGATTEVMLDETLIQVYAISSLDEDTTYTGYAYNVDEDLVAGALVLNNTFAFAGSASSLAVVESISSGINAAGNSAVQITFWQNGEVKTLAIAETAVVGSGATMFDGSSPAGGAGDIIQITTNGAGEISGIEWIYDYDAKALKKLTAGSDVAYELGLVEDITAKRIQYSNESDSSAYMALDIKGSNILFDTTRRVSNAISSKTSTSYIKGYKLNGTYFASDAYVVVVKTDDGVATDIVAYKYDKGTNVVAADFATSLDVTP